VLEKEGKSARVVRTRDMKIIKKADYVVDVGEIYDPENNRFDHHQVDGAGKRENTIPYASFGLVWKKYGEMLCESVEIANQIEILLVQPVDAHDNGVTLFRELVFKDIFPYDTQNIRKAFLPSWKEKNTDINKIFMQAVSFAMILLRREITRHKDNKEAEEIVIKSYNESKDKRLIIFDDYYGAGKHLVKFPEPLFIVFPSSDGTWILETIGDDKETYKNRKSLPENWAGQSGDSFEKITGVEGAIFCHKNLFLAVAKTKEAILKLAKLALDSQN
jgi:uncharacterized UPF0160 family protein